MYGLELREWELVCMIIKLNDFYLIKKKEPQSRITGFSVRSILEESNDLVWVSTAVLYRWNRKTGELKSYETSSDRLDDFGNTGVWTMIKSADGKIWTATTEGLYRYDPSTDKAKQYKFNPSNKLGLPQKKFTLFLKIGRRAFGLPPKIIFVN